MFREWLSAVVADLSKLPIFADWLEDRGDPRADEVRELRDDRTSYSLGAVLKKFPEAILPELNNYDWKEAFSFAGDIGYGSGVPERALPNDTDLSVEKFSRFDVKRVIASVVGERDGPDWLIVGELYDGRFFALAAGCDYTGWD